MNDKIYKGFLALLFLFVFVYLLLRIIYNETLHDEVATFILYFYHGDYVGESMHWDANNHLLNSFIGHQLYKVFGDNFAILRLPNLLAFVVYFFGTIKLTKSFKTPYLKLTSVIALNTIPFIMEYFANARGYGLSFGFFVWVLVHFINFQKTNDLRSLLYTYLFLILTVSANLTFVNTCFILLGINIISIFLRKDEESLFHKVKEWFAHIGFILLLSPFIYYGFLLREKGALYYGSLDGLWEVTGKTLSRYILFLDGDWLKYVYLLLFALLVVYLIVRLKSSKLKEWFKAPFVIYACLFFGNIIGILLLAWLLEVNYPEDRTGIYLALLFLLMLFYVFDHIKIGKWLHWLFLFFPISFLGHLSLHTSVFSPDDRMNNEFFAKVKEHTEAENSIMIYHIMNLNWPYFESHYKNKSSVGLFSDPNSTLTDIIVTKTTVITNPDISRLYDTIAVHPPSTYIAFKRKKPMIRNEIEVVIANDIATNQEHYKLAVFDCDSLEASDIQVSVSGSLQTLESKNKIYLIVSSINKDGSNGRYFYYSFETAYQSQLIDDDFLHHFVLDNISSEEKEIKVYLWNRGLHDYVLSNIISNVFELKLPENESR